MKTAVDNQRANYQVKKSSGSYSNTIDTSSHGLPDSFRTVDNTTVEVVDLVVDDNGNIIDSPVINNSSTEVLNENIETGKNANTQFAQTQSNYNNTNSSSDPASNSRSTSTLSIDSEILDESSNNGSNHSGKEDSVLSEQLPNTKNVGQDGKAIDDDSARNLGATGSALGRTPGVNSPINVDNVQFTGELTATGDDNSDSTSSKGNSSSGEASSSSHKQTESLAYYSNDWVSIFETLADSGYNSVLDTNYFNNAYASTGAKLSKNTKYVR